MGISLYLIQFLIHPIERWHLSILDTVVDTFYREIGISLYLIQFLIHPIERCHLSILDTVFDHPIE